MEVIKISTTYTDKNKNEKHWIVLLVASLLFGKFGGIINSSIGVFYSPVSEELGILRGSFALHATITLITLGIVSLFVHPIVDRYGWKPTYIVAVVLAVIGTSGMAFTNNLIVFYILGAIRGIGTGFFGMVSVAMFINNWFYEKNGLALSIASGTSGVMGIIFAPTFAKIISNFGWKIGFISMGGLILLLSIPGIFLPYSVKPEEDGLVPYGLPEQTDGSNHHKMTRTKKYDLKDAMPSFLAMVAFSILLANIIGMNQHLSSYGESIGMTLELSGYILSAVMMGNVTFKIIFGPISDRFGVIPATLIMIGSNSVSLLLMIFSQHAYVTIFAAYMFGSIFSIGSIAKPILTRQYFGVKLSEKVYPIITFASSIGTAFANTIVGYIFDFTGSYSSAFLIGLLIHTMILFTIFIVYKYSVIRRDRA